MLDWYPLGFPHIPKLPCNLRPCFHCKIARRVQLGAVTVVLQNTKIMFALFKETRHNCCSALVINVADSSVVQ